MIQSSEQVSIQIILVLLSVACFNNHFISFHWKFSLKSLPRDSSSSVLLRKMNYKTILETLIKLSFCHAFLQVFSSHFYTNTFKIYIVSLPPKVLTSCISRFLEASRAPHIKGPKRGWGESTVLVFWFAHCVHYNTLISLWERVLEKTHLCPLTFVFSKSN